mgnify:CR=1 FL=1
MCLVFFFQAEDGIRYLVRSRGLGDVYKRQGRPVADALASRVRALDRYADAVGLAFQVIDDILDLSLIHI